MRKSKFTEEQIAFVLRQAETGTRVVEVCRKVGISEQTFFRWKRKYGGLGISELRRLRQLEEENRRLKRMVADLSLDKQMLQDVLFKKALRPAQKRERVEHLQEAYRVSERRACAVVEIWRASHRYRSRRRDDVALRMRIREIAETRVRYGYLRIHVLLRREGWCVNHKRVYRIYREESLNLRRRRPRRHVTGSRRMDRPVVEYPNACWSMDFVVDSLFNGRRFRALTVVDNYSRECLAIEAGQNITGAEVVAVMRRLVKKRGVPDRLRCDNWSEFISKVLDKWAYEHGVTMDFSRPGKPGDNAMIESFNGTFRDECLDVNWFLSMEDVRERIERWREEYNMFRPHSSLGDLTPRQFAEQFAVSSQGQKTLLLAG
ncbi:MAG: IS3 family transposase, partial [Candidatus Eisenbacteria bacterium]|nr:IS3 family transposase [Candidatus Eisenbacteria bacterium]